MVRVEPDTKRGAIPELVQLVGSEMLEDVPHKAQRSWFKTFGESLTMSQLPLAYANWLSNEERQSRGRFPLFFCRWLERAKRDEARDTAKAEAE